MSAIGEQIRKLRAEKELSYKDLGDIADVHWNAIARIERGEREPDWKTVVKILKALGKEMEIVAT